MGSIAGMAAWRAHESYDETTGVPIERWIALHVKQRVWCYWRSIRDRHEQNEGEAFWQDVYTIDAEDAPGIDQKDLQILTESYIERWAMDVIARRHGVPKYKMRIAIASAKERLLKHVGAIQEAERECDNRRGPDRD